MSIHRQSYTRPLPVGAEIVEEQGRRMAAWIARGKRHTAQLVEIPGCPPRIRVKSNVFVACYRDATGMRVLRSTGCRYKENAQAWLSKRLLEVEREKVGLVQMKPDLPPKNTKKRRKEKTVESNVSKHVAPPAASSRTEEKKEPWLLALAGEPFGGVLKLIRRGQILEEKARESVLNYRAAHHVAQLMFLKSGDPDITLNSSITGLNREQRYLDAVVAARVAFKNDLLGRIWDALEKEAALLQDEKTTPDNPE